AADVLTIDQNNSPLLVDGSHAGYFLDLKPLADIDSAQNTNDFYPVVWQAYQWDGGLWAMPLSAQVLVMFYDPAAFDSANLSYPTDSWTLDDLAKATRHLTQKDPDGNVTIPGIDVFPGLANSSYLFGSLVNEALFDTT